MLRGFLYLELFMASNEKETRQNSREKAFST